MLSAGAGRLFKSCQDPGYCSLQEVHQWHIWLIIGKWEPNRAVHLFLWYRKWWQQRNLWYLHLPPHTLTARWHADNNRNWYRDGLPVSKRFGATSGCFRSKKQWQLQIVRGSVQHVIIIVTSMQAKSSNYCTLLYLSIHCTLIRWVPPTSLLVLRKADPQEQHWWKMRQTYVAEPWVRANKKKPVTGKAVCVVWDWERLRN